MARVTVNKYDIIILDKSVNGKRHRLSTFKKSSDRLLKWYNRHSEEEFWNLYYKKVDEKPSNTITFEKFGSEVIEITSKNRNQFSQIEEKQRFKKLCETFGRLQLIDIKASHIVKWQNSCGFAPKTIKNYRSTLNIILDMAMYDEIILKNPLKLIKPPKAVHKEVFVYSIKEIEKLIQNASGSFKNVIQFNFFTGLRGSELIALRWKNIDFKAKTIKIESRIRDGNEDVPKSKRVRILDMLPQARQALKRQQLLTGLNEFVFLSQYKRPYKRPDCLSKMFKYLCKQTKIRIGSFHDIRKSCNTMLKQYDLPSDWILDQLGHMDDAVNRTHYTGKIKPDLTKIGTVLAHL